MRSDKAELVFFMGTALIVAAGLTNKQLQAMWDLIFNAKNMHYTRQDARLAMVTIAGEFLLLIFLTAIAESSETASHAVIAFILVLALVWAMFNVNQLGSWSNTLTGKNKNT